MSITRGSSGFRDIDYLVWNHLIRRSTPERGPMVIIASPNLCFDRTHDIPALLPGAVIRSGAVAVTAGGKGVNVARVLRAHGRPGTLVGLVGDQDRADLLALLAAERIAVVPVAVAGRTRVNVIMIERGTGPQAEP